METAKDDEPYKYLPISKADAQGMIRAVRERLELNRSQEEKPSVTEILKKTPLRNMPSQMAITRQERSLSNYNSYTQHWEKNHRYLQEARSTLRTSHNNNSSCKGSVYESLDTS